METSLEFSSILHFSHPYFFYNFNIFENAFFSINETVLKKSEFSNLWNKKICQVGDFFDCSMNPPELYLLVQLNRKYKTNLNFLSYHRVKTVIINAAKNLNYKIYDSQLSDLQLPRLPIIHKVSCIQAKGCRAFYLALNARVWYGTSTRDCERKWQEVLETNFSVDFWDKIWKITKSALVSNKMKWINIQILRFILPTNYTVNKYKPNQDPRCSFCTTHLERLPDLIWSCQEVRGFWNMVGNVIAFYFPQFKMGRKEAIFGDINTKGDSVINTLLLLSKQFLWQQKFGSKIIDELQFIIFMRRELSFLLKVMEYKGKKLEFLNDWVQIFQHFEIDI